MSKYGAAVKDGVRGTWVFGVLPLHRSNRNVHQQDRRRTTKVVLAILVSALALLFVARDSLARLCHFPHSRLTHALGSVRSPVPSGTRNKAYIVEATNGAVASENEICSEIGVNIMKQGGNAVDAAVSTTLCIGVLNMFSCVL